jgi:hypothetical protein
MKRSFFLSALIFAGAATLVAQNASQSNPYEGTSNPPPDDTIVTTQTPQPKPPAGQPYQQPVRPAPQPVMAAQPAVQPALAGDAEANPPASGDQNADQGDNGIVEVAPDQPGQPALNQRAANYDPDGDIVHPEVPPGSLGEGTTIRVRLLQRLSSSYNAEGDTFKTSVASDVVQGGQVLIPTGSEIDGRVVRISTGHAGGHGSMRLQPETVTLPDGSHYRLYAQVAAIPGSNTHVTGEGTVVPDSRARRDGIEYGGAVGAGAVTGAVLGGPVGALTGSIVGAGLVTTHLLVDHPQATLDTGTVLIFSLTEPLTLVPATTPSGN